MDRSEIEFKVFIEDIVKSKGYKVWKNWKQPKKSIEQLVDSLNDKIKQDLKKPEDSILNIEQEEPFKQLTFDFD